jgi:hypothetical protein
MMIGLFWIAGPGWAGDDVCQALAAIAAAAAHGRDAGVPLATLLENVEQAPLSSAMRIAAQAQTHAGYAGTATPEETRENAWRHCQESRAQVEADMKQRGHPSVQRP